MWNKFSIPDMKCDFPYILRERHDHPFLEFEWEYFWLVCCKNGVDGRKLVIYHEKHSIMHTQRPDVCFLHGLIQGAVIFRSSVKDSVRNNHRKLSLAKSGGWSVLVWAQAGVVAWLAPNKMSGLMPLSPQLAAWLIENPTKEGCAQAGPHTSPASLKWASPMLFSCTQSNLFAAVHSLCMESWHSTHMWKPGWGDK